MLFASCGLLQEYITTKIQEYIMNIGMFDRLLRMGAGLGFVIFDYIAGNIWEMVFLVIGIWSVTTSVFGWCPFYKVMGFNTCPTNFTVIREESQSSD